MSMATINDSHLDKGFMKKQDSEEEKSWDSGSEPLDEEVDLIGGHDNRDVTNALKAGFKGEGATKHMLRNLNDQFESQGVKILDVMIVDVKLPDGIITQMSNKTMVISENAQQKMTQQYEMQQVKFNQEIMTMEQRFEEDRLKEIQEGEKTHNEISIKLNELKAHTDKMVKKIVEDTQVLTEQIRSEMDLEITKLDQSTNQIMTQMTSDGELESAQILAQGRLECEQILADARLEVARNDAQADLVVGQTEGQIASMIDAQLDHDTEMKKLEVFKALCTNDECILAPTDNEGKFFVDCMVVCLFV